jgi:hypothetical protein
LQPSQRHDFPSPSATAQATDLTLPFVGSVLGIDVGYSPTRKSSAVCRLNWDDRRVSWSIQRFRAIDDERRHAIIGTIDSNRLEAAAFDGPLRRDLSEIGVYRVAERLLTRGLRIMIGKPGQSSAPVGKLLNLHANHCARIVLETGLLGEARHSVRIHRSAIVEAFPSSFLGVMIKEPKTLAVRRGDRSDRFFVHLTQSGTLERLIHHCLPGRAMAGDLTVVRNHDDRAALVCAVTALCVACGSYSAVGDDNGWIILPPAAFIEPWAVELLRRNQAELDKSCLVFA